jgi:hypothetical protein
MSFEKYTYKIRNREVGGNRVEKTPQSCGYFYKLVLWEENPKCEERLKKCLGVDQISCIGKKTPLRNFPKKRREPLFFRKSFTIDSQKVIAPAFPVHYRMDFEETLDRAAQFFMRKLKERLVSLLELICQKNKRLDSHSDEIDPLKMIFVDLVSKDCAEKFPEIFVESEKLLSDFEFFRNTFSVVDGFARYFKFWVCEKKVWKTRPCQDAKTFSQLLDCFLSDAETAGVSLSKTFKEPATTHPKIKVGGKEFESSVYNHIDRNVGTRIVTKNLFESEMEYTFEDVKDICLFDVVRSNFFPGLGDKQVSVGKGEVLVLIVLREEEDGNEKEHNYASYAYVIPSKKITETPSTVKFECYTEFFVSIEYNKSDGVLRRNQAAYKSVKMFKEKESLMFCKL